MSAKNVCVRRGIEVCAVCILSMTSVISMTYAQSMERATLASSLMIEGEVQNGDLISFDRNSSEYRASRVYGDGDLFGVVVDDPVLYLESTSTSEKVRPVVRFGEATINVSTLHGEVRQGDLVTSSRISGVGARADREESVYVLGIATESMVFDTTIKPMKIDGEEVHFGTVNVALRIGTNISEEDTDMTSTSTGMGMGEEVRNDNKGAEAIDGFKVFRYVLGSFVAIAAVILALRRFGDLFAQSIVSVGRNPLARSQIRSILVWNAVLIIVVSGVGLGLGIAIIMLPI